MNPKITPRERGLLKGAVRRVFSRSELRDKVLKASIVKHTDLKRKRVKTWCKCALCGTLDAKSNMSVDHKDPVIPVTSSFEEMGLDATVDRLWCSEENLQVLCDPCHNKKSKEEAKERRLNKRKSK